MTTDNLTYRQLFHSLIQRKESEVVEFKKAENNFDFDDIGKYFSALSNEANLRGFPFACWYLVTMKRSMKSSARLIRMARVR